VFNHTNTLWKEEKEGSRKLIERWAVAAALAGSSLGAGRRGRGDVRPRWMQAE